MNNKRMIIPEPKTFRQNVLRRSAPKQTFPRGAWERESSPLLKIRNSFDQYVN